jgi:hypothetical protein
LLPKSLGMFDKQSSNVKQINATSSVLLDTYSKVNFNFLIAKDANQGTEIYLMQKPAILEPLE